MSIFLEILKLAIIAIGQILLTLRNYHTQITDTNDGTAMLAGLLLIPLFLGIFTNWMLVHLVPPAYPALRAGIAIGIGILVQVLAVGLAFNLYGS